MNKKIIRLTESDLHKIVKESVNKVIMGEAVLPDYYYGDADYYGGEEDYGDEGFMYKGDDMFPDDALYKAEMLRKMTGDKIKISVSQNGTFIMPYNGSLSIESLQLIIKVSKYLRTNRVFINDGKVEWVTSFSSDYEKSHKTQVGNKYFDNDKVPLKHKVKKPKVLHTSYQPHITSGYGGREGSGFGTDGIRTY